MVLNCGICLFKNLFSIVLSWIVLYCPFHSFYYYYNNTVLHPPCCKVCHKTFQDLFLCLKWSVGLWNGKNEFNLAITIPLRVFNSIAMLWGWRFRLLSPLWGLIDHTPGSCFINGPHPSASPRTAEEEKPMTVKCHHVEGMKGAGAVQKACVPESKSTHRLVGPNGIGCV